MEISRHLGKELAAPGPRSGSSGFTLIELMIVVAIVSLLAAIGYPNYTAYVERGKRAEGRGLLVEAANRLERYYSDCNRYPATLATTGANNCATNTVVVPATTSENNYYTLAISGVTGTMQVFTLTVTPAGVWTDSNCGNLTLTNAGVRGRTGSGKTAQECWGK